MPTWLDIELNGLHYRVREPSPGNWVVLYGDSLVRAMTAFEVALMRAAYRQGQLALL